MIRIVYRFLLATLFGKESLDGYCKTNSKKEIEKVYVFASVFPNRDSMERALQAKQDS